MTHSHLWLTTHWGLFELLHLLSTLSSKRLHVSFKGLQLSLYIFVLWERSLAVNWRYSTWVFTVFEIFISVGFVGQKVDLLVILILFIYNDGKIPSTEIVLRIDDVPNPEFSYTYTFSENYLGILSDISLKLCPFIDDCFFFTLLTCAGLLLLMVSFTR